MNQLIKIAPLVLSIAGGLYWQGVKIGELTSTIKETNKEMYDLSGRLDKIEQRVYELGTQRWESYHDYEENLRHERKAK